MTAERTFVDTNILLYAYDIDAGEKHRRAREVLRHIWSQRTGALSTQVLQEFYVNATRKLRTPLERTQARQVLQTYAAWQVWAISASDVLEATRVEAAHRLSFWDALIVTAALGSGATLLLSEDLGDGQHIEGLRVENPLK